MNFGSARQLIFNLNLLENVKFNCSVWIISLNAWLRHTRLCKQKFILLKYNLNKLSICKKKENKT